MLKFIFLEGIARMPQLQNPNISYSAKLDLLKKEAAFNPIIQDLQISNTQGITYSFNGLIDDSNKSWYQSALKGEKGIAEPFLSKEKAKTQKNRESLAAEEKFNAIFSLAEQVKEMSDRLTESMKEQENGSREVLTAIKDINTVTVAVQAGSEEMLKGGESVAQEMHTLDNLTRVITDSMNEMASGAIEINNAVQEVHEITQKNKRSVEGLANEVSKFKVN